MYRICIHLPFNTEQKTQRLDQPYEEYGIQPFAYSGWGATLRYDFAKDAGQVITMARISPDCSHMMIAKGTIVGGGGVDSQNCSLSVIFTVDNQKDSLRNRFVTVETICRLYTVIIQKNWKCWQKCLVWK